MAWARTVAVVVPSPATSLVLEATSRTICAPRFSRLSGSSISFATVTPSLVIVGEPNFFSMTTLRPLGPRVTFTASAKRFTPRRIACRASSPCTICFAIIFVLLRILKSSTRIFTDTPTRRSEDRLSLGSYGLFLRRTGDDAQDLLLLHDEEVFSIKLDLGAGVLAEQNAVALLYRERKDLAFVIGLASANRDDFPFLWFIFGRIGNDEATPSGASFFYSPHQDAVVEWGKFCSHTR